MKYKPSEYYNDEYGSHKRIAELTGSRKYVLDVGCGGGYLAETLVAQDCRVIGLEIDPVAIPRARKVCENVLVIDLEKIESLVFTEQFDVIICADILEHLRDPEKTLRALSVFLKPDGCFILSLPNITYISSRVRLLMGKFEYTEKGIMDKTHLRFFTRSTMLDLIKQVGFEPENIIPTPSMPTPLWNLMLRPNRRGQYKIAHRFPTLFAFQFIIKATQVISN